MRNERQKKREEKTRENENLLILINRQTDRQTDRDKSFIDMRYYTEEYSKSDSIKSNRIESNQFEMNQFEMK